MKNPIHYSLFLNPPKKIPLSKEDFHNLSYYGVANLFVNYKLVIIDEDTFYKCYLRQSGEFEYLITHNYRFKDLDWFEDPTVELSIVSIEKNSKYGKFITNKLQHLTLT